METLDEKGGTASQTVRHRRIYILSRRFALGETGALHKLDGIMKKEYYAEIWKPGSKGLDVEDLRSGKRP